MKTYTHPTIYLPAGTVVVKFYDASKSGTDTTPDCIIDIGDVEEGFDIDLGSPYLPECQLTLHNRSNYVLGTLLDTKTLEFSITVNDDYYFFGVVDFDRINVSGIETASSLLGKVTISGIHVFSKLKDIGIKEISDLVTPLYVNLVPTAIYMKHIFALFALQSGLTYVTAADVSYLTARLFKFYDTINDEWLETTIEELVIEKANLIVDTTEIVLDGYLQRKIDNMLDLMAILSKDFFLYFSIVYVSGAFKLRVTEKDASYTVTTLGVKQSLPQKRYLLRSLTTQIEELPVTTDTTMLYYSDKLTDQTIGEDMELKMRFCNVERYDGINPTGSGTLNQTPSNINVSGNDAITGPGTAYISVSSVLTQFKYNYKDATTFYGCTIETGTVNYTGASIVLMNEVYWAHNRIYVHWVYANDIGIVERIYTPRIPTGESDLYYSIIELMHELYKAIYYDNNNWRNIKVVGIGATYSGGYKLQYLMPGYRLSHFSQVHFIHSVKKSLMKNESSISAIIIG